MASLTVFTPTYNRKETLKDCYESLCKQDDSSFIWMIIDDGSTDGTSKEVSSWIHENRIEIEYYYQENAGKPAATNRSLELLKTELWICLDSDDILTSNAVSAIKEDYEKAKNNPKCCGIVYNKHELHSERVLTINGKSSKLPEDVRFATHIEIEYVFHANGDKAYVYFANVLRDFRFPIIEGERFIGESYQHTSLAAKNVFFISHKRIYLFNYRPDGLSANNRKLHAENPQGYKLLKQQLMLLPVPIITRIKAAIMYVAACKLCGDRGIILKSPKPLLTLFALFPGLIAYQRYYAKV